MITKTQTDIEKKREVFRDSYEINEQLTKIIQRSDYVRAVKKAPKFPFNYTTHFKSKRGNRYTIILTPLDKKKGGLENPLTSIYTKLSTEEGVYMLRYDSVKYNLTIYTPHFFSRYKSRFLKEDSLSPEEVIDTFAKRNFNLVRSTEAGEEYIGTCTDGYIHLKHKEGGVTIAVTFVSFDMLRKEQTDKTEILLDFIKKHEEFVTLNK